MQITNHIHALKIPFRVTIAPNLIIDRFVFVYLIYGEKVWLIDMGVSGSCKLICDYLTATGRKPADIEKIFLTHSHPDHIGAAKSIKETTGCSVWIHSAERRWAEDVELQSRERPVPQFNSLVEGNVKIDKTIEDGDIYNLDRNLILKAIHSPGHSAGSVSFLLNNDNALLCGDAILPPMQMPIFDNLSQCICSINKLKALENIEWLLSSWDEPRQGKCILSLMDNSLKYLQKIRAVMENAAQEKLIPGSMDFCKHVISKLKLPASMVNPLVARSFIK